MRTDINHRSNHRSRLVASMLVVAMVLSNFAFVSAAPLTSAYLELGDPRTGQASNYTLYGESFSTGTAIACVEVELDTQANGGGVTPPGVLTGSQGFVSSSLLSDANWAVDNSVSGSLRLINSSTTEAPSATGNVIWSNITNGSVEGSAYFALVTTYTDSSCTGGNEVDTVTLGFTFTDGELVSLEIGPALTFSVGSLASGSSVNGATTNTNSTASGINYGTVSSAANEISAHEISVTTNAPGGYTVSIRHSQNFQNYNAAYIPKHTGTNASPTAFSAPGTEAWGYTTDDSTLSGTADRFTSSGGNKWAGFETTNEEVMYNNAASAGVETTRVGHQVGISTDTDSGTYQTVIIYTMVAIY